MENKETYVKPLLEIITFQFEDSIALSGNDAMGASLFEEWD